MKKCIYYIVVSIVSLIFFGCKEDTFTKSGMAEDHFFLKCGNQHMPITVAGNVDSRKFIIIVHGGPGGSSIDYRDNYIKNIVEKEFAVVYWDQRFAGNTQGNGGNTDITEFRKDIKKLLLLLGAEYGNDNDFYLLGHSWGGFLVPYFLVEDDNQKMVKGWIQTDGGHNYHLNDSLTREMLLRYGKIELAAGNNTSDWNEMVDWCNQNGFEDPQDASTLNQFAYRAEGLIEAVTTPELFPDFSQLRAKAIVSGWSNGIASSIRSIDSPAYTTPNTDQLFKIHIPTLLLWGKYDFVCPSELANDIKNNIGSSDVKTIIYLTSGHSPMVNEPNKYWADVVNWIKLH